MTEPTAAPASPEPITSKPKAEPYEWTPVRAGIALALVVGILGPLVYYAYGQISKFVGQSRASGPIEEVFDLDNLQIPEDQILSGGQPKDGIPALTKPKTVSAAKFTSLAPDARIVAVTVNGKTRGYPIGVLNFHEAINDKLGGVPVAVVYCPLCDSASVVDRRLEGKTYEFGISGRLCYSNVLLYDRTDNALWSQVGLMAVSGPNAGKSLKHLDDWQILHLGQFKKQYPKATIVSTRTGHRRDYRSNPYGSYFHNDQLIGQFVQFELDRRYPNKARMIGVRHGDVAKAYLLSEVRKAPGGTIEDQIAGGRVRLRYDGEADTLHVAEVPEAAQVVHTFWFAWAKFHPGTLVYEGAGNASDKDKNEAGAN